MAALDDFMAMLTAHGTPPGSIDAQDTEILDGLTDPCARVTVKPVRGGMPDAPIEVHEHVMVRDPACNVRRGKCPHLPRHESMAVIKCKPGQPCECPPVNVDAHYDAVQGIRVKGTPLARKRLKDKATLDVYGERFQRRLQMEVKPVPEPEWQGTELELPPLPLFLDKITKEMRALDEKRRLEGVRAMSGIWADGPPRSRTPEEVAALRAELRRKMEARRK